MEIEKLINYEFNNKELLEEALRHTSYANETNTKSYEKLEFFGDAILEFVVSEYLYEKYTNLSEGELTKLRAMVVCEDSLHEVAKRLELSDFIKVGSGEFEKGEHHRASIMADVVEAIIAAIYLDNKANCGLASAKKFILSNLKDYIDVASHHVGEKDFKTVLQEKLQRNGNVHIEYRTIKETGPEHDKTFEVEVLLNGKVLASGIGKNKKSAEMDAARKALGE